MTWSVSRSTSCRDSCFTSALPFGRARLGSGLNPIEPSLIPCYLPFKAFFSCLIRQRLKRLAIVFSFLHRSSTVAPAGHQIVDSRLDFPLQDHALVYLHSRDPNIHLEDGCEHYHSHGHRDCDL